MVEARIREDERLRLEQQQLELEKAKQEEIQRQQQAEAAAAAEKMAVKQDQPVNNHQGDRRMRAIEEQKLRAIER